MIVSRPLPASDSSSPNLRHPHRSQPHQTPKIIAEKASRHANSLRCTFRVRKSPIRYILPYKVSWQRMWAQADMPPVQPRSRWQTGALASDFPAGTDKARGHAGSGHWRGLKCGTWKGVGGVITPLHLRAKMRASLRHT